MAEKSFREKKSTVRRIFIDPSTPPMRSVLRVVLVFFLGLAILLILGILLYLLSKLIFVIILSVFFAYLIEPLVQLIRQPFEMRQREALMPRPLAIVLAYVLVFSALGFSIAALAPTVSEQAGRFAANLPSYTVSLQTSLRNISNRFDRYRVPDAVQNEIVAKASAVIGDIGTQVTSFLIIFATYLPWLILVPILAFFFLKDANLFRLSLLRIFPSGRWRSRAELFIHDVNRTLANYTRAQLISCIFIGTVCAVGFYLIGVNYALLLGIVAGVLEFIPLIGPLTVGIIAVTVAALESPWEAFYTFLFLAVLRIVHDYITYPRIVRGGIHMHPLAIILSVLAGEQIAGIPGVFISIPVVALLTVLYRHILEHRGSKGLFSGLFEVESANGEGFTDEELTIEKIEEKTV